MVSGEAGEGIQLGSGGLGAHGARMGRKCSACKQQEAEKEMIHFHENNAIFSFSVGRPCLCPQR